MLPEFQALATRVGIALPRALSGLLASGRTVYPPGWWEHAATEPPALTGHTDFEWLTAESAAQTVDQWLNPQAQSGHVFLPFGQSGAGDAYCLVRLADGEEGVAMIWHDESSSTVAYANFEDFVCAGYVQAFGNFDFLAEESSEDEALACLQEDVRRTAEHLIAARRDHLLKLLGGTMARRPYQYGPKARPERVLSLLGQEAAAKEELLYLIRDPTEIEIVPRWELRES